MKCFLAVVLLAAAAIATPHVRYISKTGDGHHQDFEEVVLSARAATCPSKSGGSKLSSSEKSAYLKEHNTCRQKENAGLPDLKWDDSLARRAQDLVDQQSGCDMQHKLLECDGNRLGQNLAWDWSSNTQQGNMPASKAVGMWYGEKKDYNLRSNSCRGVCGHYTQIVWKKTTKVGCAARVCGNSRLVACDYYPPGNYIGQKPY